MQVGDGGGGGGAGVEMSQVEIIPYRLSVFFQGQGSHTLLTVPVFQGQGTCALLTNRSFRDKAPVPC